MRFYIRIVRSLSVIDNQLSQYDCIEFLTSASALLLILFVQIRIPRTGSTSTAKEVTVYKSCQVFATAVVINTGVSGLHDRVICENY